MRINFIGDTYLSGVSKISSNLKTDNLIVNLEAPFSNEGEPAKNKINLSMDKDHFFKTFEGRNILAVNLANNHIMDFGERSYSETLKILTENRIPYFGAGTEENNFNNPLIIDKSTALFGYACRSVNGVYGDAENSGAAPFSFEKVFRDIENYKDRYSIIVNIHWGMDYHSFPKPEDVKTARKLIDSGVQMIIGHHPHVTQTHEIYKGRNIFYSIGNAIFDDIKKRSFFNGSEYTNNYTSSWKKRNRVSIGVRYDTSNMKTEHFYLFYRNRILREYRNLFYYSKNSILLNRFWFKIYRLYLKRKTNIEHFLDNPRIPSMAKLLKFFGVKNA